MSEDYLTIGEARARKGLRLVMMRGFPSPWTQAARGLFYVKGIAFDKVAIGPDEPRELLREWTGQDSFPAAMLDDERPRTGWEEILWLAERLSPTPSLIPSDPNDRIRMLGLSREICGEMGLGWCRRLTAMGLAADAPPAGLEAFHLKYGATPEEGARARERVIEILKTLTAQIVSSRDEGYHYLMGARISAVDIYWATFCNLLAPLEAERMPTLPDSMRGMFTATEPDVVAAVDPLLLTLRDLVYAEHLELPVEL